MRNKRALPKTATVLPTVWQLKRKIEIKSGTIKNHKARLNINNSNTKQGIYNDQSYAPAASWNSIRMLLIMTDIHDWHTQK